MGIPHLTRLLLSYADVIRFGNLNSEQDGIKRVTSVVIDGPALVYHVYFCLLSRIEQRLNPMDAQPSSNEVSVGVMTFLLHLKNMGVTVESIYFDGALPVSKRETRLDRLGNSRQKLENFCLATPGGFKLPGVFRDTLEIEPSMVFNKKPQFSKFTVVPENPFMTASVTEDLKERWNWERIAEFAPHILESVTDPTDYPWANITEVVLGEADPYCAATARTHGAAVLTGDSDLLLYELGTDGSVIFFDSLEYCEAQNEPIGPVAVRATEMSPSKIAKKLGAKSIQRFAFELKSDRFSPMSTIVQRSKGEKAKVEFSASYLAFIKEYSSSEFQMLDGENKERKVHALDSKVSELLPQFQDSEFTPDNKHIMGYLPMLIENHNRKCAWVDGRDIRAIGYSMLNLSLPKARRKSTVHEHSRRGNRIFATPITLLAQNTVETMIEDLIQRLDAVTYTNDATAPNTWRLSALLKIYSDFDQDSIPSRGHLRKFFEKGYTGEKLEWNDIHLNAQIQSVLYSFRILKQLVGIALPELDGSMQTLGTQLLNVLSNLPPLRILSESRSELRQRAGPKGYIDSLLDTMFAQLQQSDELDDAETGEVECQSCYQNPDGNLTVISNESWEAPKPKKRKRAKRVAGTESRQRPNPTSNMYDILRKQ